MAPDDHTSVESALDFAKEVLQHLKDSGNLSVEVAVVKGRINTLWILSSIFGTALMSGLAWIAIEHHKLAQIIAGLVKVVEAMPK